MDELDALRSHLTDLAKAASRRGAPVFTDFLDPAQQGIAVAAADTQRVPYRMSGGYPDAERRMVCLGEIWDEDPQYPMTVLEAKWNSKFASCAHRDILGSLMALGVERECFGDILIDDDNARAIVFVTEAMESFLLSNWESAGNAALTVRTITDPGEIPPPKGEEVRVNVPSLRLDAVLAEVFRMSRAKAQEIILSGKVRVSFAECVRTDRMLKSGEIVSVRGTGRFRMLEEEGRTRRDRLYVRVFRFEHK